MTEICENLVKIEGSKKILERFKEIVFKNNTFSMNNLDVSSKKGESILEWGTVSDASNVLIKFDGETVTNLEDNNPNEYIYIQYETEVSPNIEFWLYVKELFEDKINIGHVYYCDELEYAGIIEIDKDIKEYYIENNHNDYKKSIDFYSFIIESDLEFKEYIKEKIENLIKKSKITLSDIKAIKYLNKNYNLDIQIPSQIVYSIDDIN